MGLFNRARRKSAEGQEWQEKLLQMLGVDGQASADALSEATYYACLKVLSEAIGKMPMRVQRYDDDGGVSIMRRHRCYRMIAERPNPFMTATTFWTTMEFNRNHYGNAYAWLDERDFKNPKMWILDPNAVTIWYDNACRFSDVPGVWYQFTQAGQVAMYSSDEVIHLKAFHTRDGIEGISVRDQLRATIAGNAKAQKMLNKMTDNGMTAKSVLQYTGALSEKNVSTLVQMVDEFVSGEIKDAESGKKIKVRNIIPVPTGFTLTPLNVKLADAQFLELRQYSATQIAAAFGVMPSQIGDYTKSSYASAEAQQLAFLVGALMRTIKEYEEEIAYKCLLDRDVKNDLFVKLDTSVMLRADQETMIRTLSQAVSSFLMTPNEARKRLDLPAKPGGDRLLGNGSSIPVELTGTQYVKNTENSEGGGTSE